MHHILAYKAAPGAAATLADMTAVLDTEFSIRNNHFIFSEDYNLLGSAGFGALATDFQLKSPTLNAVTAPAIWPFNTALTVPSPPRIDHRLMMPMPIPQSEELQALVSVSAADTDYAFLMLQPDKMQPPWSQNIPKGIGPVPVFSCEFTCPLTSVLGTWTPGPAITLSQNLRQGAYAVVGAQMQATNLLAFRFVFNRSWMYQGRRMRPGMIGTNALGDEPWPPLQTNPMVWGDWGHFSTFELPSVDQFYATSAAQTPTGRLWLVRVSENPDQIY